MRILFLHQIFASQNEEGSGRAYDFAVQLVRDGHDVTIIASPFSYLTGQTAGGGERRWSLYEREQHPAGFEVLRVWALPGYHQSYFRRAISLASFMVTALLAALVIRPYDVLVANTPPVTIAMVGSVAAFLRRVPLVMEIRDLWLEAAGELGVVKSTALLGIAKAWQRAIQHQAHAIVINSPGFVPYLVKDGVQRDRIRLVPNGVDTAVFRPGADGEGVRRARGLEGKFVVMYAGALGLANDLPTILNAAEELKGERDVVIALVGDGNRRREAESDAQRRGLANVKFLGTVPKQDVPACLAAADVALCTLLDTPLFRTVYPNKVFDAMACGRPVIILVDGVIREVVERAGAGVFVQPGDAKGLASAILKLKASPDDRRRLGDNGRKAVEQSFNRWSCARQMTTVLEEVGAGLDRSHATSVTTRP